MQKFQYPYLLHLLWLLIPFVMMIIWYIRWKKNTIEQLFSPEIRPTLLPHYSQKNMIVKAMLAVVIYIILIVGMANPQLGTKKEKMQGKGVDCMILLDVSNSMMAQDIQPNRLERAKLFITKLLDKLQNDRVGLIIFAGEAYVQVPLTIDYSAIKMSMPFVSPAAITSQGTSIGEAVALAEETLGNKDIQNKAIVIITDGEDHEKEAEDAIASAKKKGIKTFSIGVGEEQGAPIPMGNGDNKKDEQGNEVKTAFNRKMLEELASIGNGNFYHLGQQSDIVDEVAHSIQEIEGKNFEEFFFSSYESYFYYFLIAVLLLVIIDFFVPEGTWQSLYRRQTMLLLGMILIGNTAFGQDQIKEHKEELNKKIRQGNKNYETKNLQKAEIEYRKALQLSSKSQVANYNLGNALYEQNKYQESKEFFAKSASLASDKMTKAKSYHNLGNALYKNNETDEAIKAYENALKLNPQDMDTKYNLALAKRKKKNNGGSNKNQNQQNQQNQQNKSGDGKKDSKDNKGDNKQNQDQRDPQNKNQNGQPKDPSNDPGQKPEPQQGNAQGKMSKEEAENLLDALKNQEQNTQRKVQMKKGKPEQKKREKDW